MNSTHPTPPPRAHAAVDPSCSAVVHASAGTGKTWLLVTRIVRLLLDGARPSGVLALTFTRRAAAEMHQRLRARLLELATVPTDDARLLALHAMGLDPEPIHLQRAARLYEDILYSEPPITLTTFHAFCQDLLKRFPLEAGVPPGFELIETIGSVRLEALEALYAEAGARPEGRLATALGQLFDHYGGGVTERLLDEFLTHRSDFWAYTEDTADPVEYACAACAELLHAAPETDPLAEFWGRWQVALLQYVEFRADADALRDICASPRLGAAEFSVIHHALVTEKRTLRIKVAPKHRDLKEALMSLHTELGEAVLNTSERLRTQRNFILTEAWLRAGYAFLQHFQRIKREQRRVDFSDLEWQAYRLLTHADQAEWVQYKLDARIEHILVDEFQDTNPTQWRLLKPLLAELAVGDAVRRRSAFIVGDIKQSIYGFRRAEPELMQHAALELHTGLDAVQITQCDSWRSAPAILTVIDCVFQAHAPLPDYTPHRAVRDTLWGHVELLPLVAGEDKPVAVPPHNDTLRDPLREPRPEHVDQRHYQAGLALAQRMRGLVEGRVAIESSTGTRPIRYDDMLLLVRQRTHLATYQQALRAAGIPFSGAERGALLDSPEIRDLLALLGMLTTPYDSLALATVLRCPLFAADEQDLVWLAEAEGSWYERLLRYHSANTNAPLARAARLLPQWHTYAQRLPVHDLFDRIANEGDLMRRYAAAFPHTLAARVRANLRRFMQLALEVDSGRYPSPTEFLERLKALGSHGREAPDAGEDPNAAQGVRILTIHAAKGLEAAAVFLADAAAVASERGARALVSWPPQTTRPTAFLLLGNQDQHDSISADLAQQQRARDAREGQHLLYVALTRARQFLCISAVAPRRVRTFGWYGLVQAALTDLNADALEGALIYTSGDALTLEPNTMSMRPAATATSEHTLPAEARLIPFGKAAAETARSDTDALRGRTIHRLLELGSAPTTRAHVSHAQRAARYLECAPDDDFVSWWTEAHAVLTAHPLLFDPAHYLAAHNEMPISYTDGAESVFGVIDRVVIYPEAVLLLDYKTHRRAAVETPTLLAEDFRPQLARDARGARRIWPTQTIKTALLFTAYNQCYRFDEMEDQ